jgi:mRNA-degrading endonuclease toxin of MazEF toxin-antitoxin module
VNRGEVYRTADRAPERGGKPGYYVVVSRTFIAENDDVETVVCAPVYGRRLGISTEVTVGLEEGVRRPSVIRCDFLALVFKRRLSSLVGSLGPAKLGELDGALAIALGLE